MALGQSPGCRGVPFFSRKQVLAIPIAAVERLDASEVSLPGVVVEGKTGASAIEGAGLWAVWALETIRLIERSSFLSMCFNESTCFLKFFSSFLMVETEF